MEAWLCGEPIPPVSASSLKKRDLRHEYCFVVCLILTDHIAFLVLNSMLITDEIGQAKKVQEVVRVRVKSRVESFDDAHARFVVEAV